MNCTTYLFGELLSGYTQYPDDSSSVNFQKCILHSTAPSQLVIHRDDDLMYYSYVRRLENNKYIGFAAVINGYYITRPIELFSTFEQLVEKLLEEGVIINFLSDGRITSSLTSMTQEEETVCAALIQLQQSLESNHSEKRLPPTDYSVAIDSLKRYSSESEEHEIAEASYRFGYTIILKEKDYDNLRVNSWKNILRNLTNERRAFAIENEELKNENTRILKEKKQVKNIIILSLVVIGCIIGIYFLRENLTNTRGELDTANNAINYLSNTVNTKNDQITELQQKLEDTEAENTLLMVEKASLMSKYPIIITDIEVQPRQLKIHFQWISDSETEIRVVIQQENGPENNMWSGTISNRNDDTLTLNLPDPLDTSKYYYILVFCDDRVIGGKRW
ncbi:MAG: hypothetical protein HDS64_01630 [Bacteroidales bacterium]|nr:hypothetical protein [Bacteroidales bacterium]